MPFEDIVVASTTDTQQEVNQAAGLPTDAEVETEAQVPNEEQQQPDEKSEAGKTGKPEGQKTEGEGEDEGDKGHKDHKKLLKRIDTLTRLRREAEEREQQTSQRLEEALRKTGVKTGGAEPPAKPKRADFQNDEDYETALFSWKEAEDRRKAADERLTSTFSAYNKGIETVKTQHDDWDEVMSQDIPIPMAVQNTIIGMGAKGPEVAYWLASNPDICDELVEVERSEGSAAAVLELGRYLAGRDTQAGGGSVSARRGAQKPEDDEEEQQAATPPAARRPQSRAPQPLKPVTGVSTRSTVPLDEMDFQDYRRIRDQQEKARRQR